MFSMVHHTWHSWVYFPSLFPYQLPHKSCLLTFVNTCHSLNKLSPQLCSVFLKDSPTPYLSSNPQWVHLQAASWNLSGWLSTLDSASTSTYTCLLSHSITIMIAGVYFSRNHPLFRQVFLDIPRQNQELPPMRLLETSSIYLFGHLLLQLSLSSTEFCLTQAVAKVMLYYLSGMLRILFS